VILAAIRRLLESQERLTVAEIAAATRLRKVAVLNYLVANAGAFRFSRGNHDVIGIKPRP
jgi:hypothetical protein